MPSWIGWPEIIIIAVVLLVVFGPKRLPELGQSIGKTIIGFKKGLKDAEHEVRKGLEADEASSEPTQAETAGSSAAKADASKSEKDAG